jgi:hypothetical protein
MEIVLHVLQGGDKASFCESEDSKGVEAGVDEGV